MKFDLTNLITNVTDAINISEEVIIPDEILKDSEIRKLNNVIFKGKIFKDYDMNLILEGVISGVMILPDDVTLEDVECEFKGEVSENIDEILKLEKNTIDILDILWQNILVEIPLKVRNSNSNVKFEGEGWRLISEDEYNNQKYNPFSDLSKLLEKGGK